MTLSSAQLVCDFSELHLSAAGADCVWIRFAVMYLPVFVSAL